MGDVLEPEREEAGKTKTLFCLLWLALKAGSKIFFKCLISVFIVCIINLLQGFMMSFHVSLVCGLEGSVLKTW